MKTLVRNDIQNTNEIIDGIFLTHAHIGHYTGLMYLGKEATESKGQIKPLYLYPILINGTNGIKLTYKKEIKLYLFISIIQSL